MAARLHRLRSPLQIDRIRRPLVGNNDLLLEVRASGICHSDINYRDGVAPVRRIPITLGHEIAGTVAKRGRGVKELLVGDRVVAHYISSCGRCLYCRTNRENHCISYRMIGKDLDGGFAEYVAIPGASAVRLPRSIPFHQGAILGCAVSTAYHALRRGRVKPEDNVVVIGVGGLGMHAVQLAKRIFHARSVIALDRFDWKIKRAKEFGADHTVNVASHDAAQAVRRLTNGMLADVVFNFVGSAQSNRLGLSCVGKGGRLVLVGIGVESMTISTYRTIIGRELEIIGVDDHLKTELSELVKLVESGRLDLSHSVTHTVPLEAINDGFRILEDGEERPIRVVVSNEN